MIGVDTDPSYYPVAREFFELFKTPWALFEEGHRYDVVLTTKPHNAVRYSARLTILFQVEQIASGELASLKAEDGKSATVVRYRGWKLPIYGECVAYVQGGEAEPVLEATGKPVMRKLQADESSVVAIGWHLFAEVAILLTKGQPEAFAQVPTLDVYIDLVRSLILEAGIELLEIPPVPAGYKFIACLTHDVDHPLIAAHKWDHTMFGFLFRATVGSIRSFFLGKRGWRDLVTNWIAALNLPFVHLGLTNDFWAGFEDRFRSAEGTRRSTYFLIPFKGVSGIGKQGMINPARAAGYCAAELKGAIERLASYGCEVGLHGIDAWGDSGKAVEELEEIRRLTDKSEVGVRMHWLYYSPESPLILEKAGARYDSTVGYNNTIGYRAGTTQAYRPLGCERLLELPLHAMDTAMFYPAYLNLTQQQAISRFETMIDFAAHHGGTLIVNWHDRSLAPERLWSASYKALIHNIEKSGGWFATASQTRQWFQIRRSATFSNYHPVVMTESERDVKCAQTMPPLILRSHRTLSHAMNEPSKVDQSLDRQLQIGIGAPIIQC